jgi:hypothetical protein
MAGFITHRPLVIHTFDDELTMAQWCEAIWPCEKSARIRCSIAAEFKERAAQKQPSA